MSAKFGLRELFQKLIQLLKLGAAEQNEGRKLANSDGDYIEIRYAYYLTNYELDRLSRQNGPLFYRWLPDDKKDALSISYPASDAAVSIWFERRCFVDDSGWIRYDPSRRENIADEVFLRQSIIDGGPLFGSIRIFASSDEISAVLNDETGGELYLQLAKRTVKKVIDPLLENFVAILRCTFGQFWVYPYSKFDSRTHSLGHHCSLLQMKWYIGSDFNK